MGSDVEDQMQTMIANQSMLQCRANDFTLLLNKKVLEKHVTLKMVKYLKAKCRHVARSNKIWKIKIFIPGKRGLQNAFKT